ncbi:major nonstructural protein [Baboon orthoreovirus]|uniref:Major nonstructural protein n=1 Tax=Baboon orthoreovirus TaxID=75888 RepID=G0YZM4_9REOV|nr:major nonstructural protein [Baboon orthoreovirus]AEK86194.1 major nonstructural protein [Baboon orthoreovirus]
MSGRVVKAPSRRLSSMSVSGNVSDGNNQFFQFSYRNTDGSVVEVGGRLLPSQAYLQFHKNLVMDLLQCIVDNSLNLSEAQLAICKIKPGLPFQEIINRLQRFVMIKFNLKMSEDTMLTIKGKLAQNDKRESQPSETASALPSPKDKEEEEMHLQIAIKNSIETLNSDERYSPQDEVIRPVPKPRTFVHKSFSPGRFDPEIYNASRCAFMTHNYEMLEADNDASTDFLSTYLQIIPRHNGDSWIKHAYIGQLIIHPHEVLDVQTTFNLEYDHSQIVLMSDKLEVARYDTHDVSDLIREHNQFVIEGNPTESKYGKLCAKHKIIFFTPMALRYIIDKNIADSVVNGQHIRVCVGFDPYYTQMTQDGVNDCAYLMDDKHTKISHGRMLRRVWNNAPINLANRWFQDNCLGKSECLSQYYQLNCKVSDSYDVICEAHQIEKHHATMDEKLDQYLENHTCVNTNGREIKLLQKMMVADDVIDRIKSRRSYKHKEITEKYIQIGREMIADTGTDFKAMYEDLEAIYSDLMKTVEEQTELIETLQARVETLEIDKNQLEHSNAVMAKKYYQISTSTRRPSSDSLEYETPRLDVDPLPDLDDHDYLEDDEI